MKISSWNVNSVRARIQNISNYLKDSEPDVLLIQEIKTIEETFPFLDHAHHRIQLASNHACNLLYF